MAAAAAAAMATAAVAVAMAAAAAASIQLPGSSSQLPAKQQPGSQLANCYGVSAATTSQPAIQIQPQQHTLN